MKTLFKILLVGIVIGAILFGISRSLYPTPKEAEGFIMAALVILIVLTTFFVWTRPPVLGTSQTPHRVDVTTQRQDLIDYRQRESLSIYGYSFAVGAVVLLILDTLIR